jgi:hypothetical protein
MSLLGEGLRQVVDDIGQRSRVEHQHRIFIGDRNTAGQIGGG